MTVKELIEKLQEMPQDLEVFDFNYERVTSCHIIENFYDGDPANPNCPEIMVVMID